MNKKVLVSLASVLAIAGFATTPAASQAIMNVYVTNFHELQYTINSNVSQYERATGHLVELPPLNMPVEAGVHPTWPVSSPDERSLYVTNERSHVAGSISEYHFGQNGKLLPQVNAPKVASGVEPEGMAVASPNGRNNYPAYAYVAVEHTGAAHGDVWEYKINTSDELELLSNPNETIEAGVEADEIAVTPDNKCVYVTGYGEGGAVEPVWEYEIGSGGVLTKVGTQVTGKLPLGVAVTPNSKYVYVAISGQNEVAEYERVSTATCELSKPKYVSTGAGTSVPRGIAVDTNEKYAYVTNDGSNNISEYEIKAGALTPLPTPTIAIGETGLGQIAITPDFPESKNVYVTNGGSNSVSEYEIESAGISAGQLKPVPSFPTIKTGTEPYGIDVVPEALPRPTVATNAASSITDTSATLNGTVNPNGAGVTKCEFQYGTTNSYGNTASCSSLPGSGEEPVAVSASVELLISNVTYHFRIVATSERGTSYSSDQTFMTLPNSSQEAPTVVTGSASAVGSGSATLNATVNPNEVAIGDCHFEYGTTTSYGSSAPCVPMPIEGEQPLPVAAAVTGLASNITYHFRISAANGGGTSKGSDETFKTLASPPTVVTEPASSITKASGIVNASVNPNNAEVTTCEFEYGTTASYGSTVPCASLPGSGSSPVGVSASLGSLSKATTYHFRISATNLAGTTKGSDRTFTTQSSDHYYSEDKILKEGVKTPIVSWGTLKLTISLKPSEPIECENVAGGFVENPVGGGPGIGETNGSSAYHCKDTPECEAANGTIAVLAENEGTPGLTTSLKWGNELVEEEGKIRLLSKNVRVYFGCYFFVLAQAETLFEAGTPPHFVRSTEELEVGGTVCTTNAAEGGVQHPTLTNGNEAAKPSKVVFGAGAGELACKVKNPANPSEEITSKVAMSGSLKTSGYKEQETITTKKV